MKDIVGISPECCTALSDRVCAFIDEEFVKADGKLYAHDIFPALTYALARYVARIYQVSPDPVIRDIRDVLVKYGAFIREN